MHNIQIIDPKHPWHGETGVTIEHGNYGLLKREEKWKIQLKNGVECYAKTNQLRQA